MSLLSDLSISQNDKKFLNLFLDEFEGEKMTLSDHCRPDQDNESQPLPTQEDHQKQKQNIIKNILKGFSKVINSPSLRTEGYELLNSVSFSEIRKDINKKIRAKDTRWNMKLKSILLNKRSSPSFKFFLIHDSLRWLNSSKVHSVQSHKQLIEFLIFIIKNGDIEHIKTYKKK